jgi:hypothetical protein
MLLSCYYEHPCMHPCNPRSMLLAVKGCSRGVFEAFGGTLLRGLLAKWGVFWLYRKTYYFGVQKIYPKKASFRMRQHHLLLHGDG